MTMDIKKQAIRIAKKEIMRNKTAKKTVKAARISGCLLGGTGLYDDILWKKTFRTRK